jgi:hypothetical protein
MTDPNIQRRKAIQIPNPEGATIRLRRSNHAAMGTARIGRMKPPSPAAHQSGNPRKRA